MKTWPDHRKCPGCSQDLFGQEFESVQINCETTRHILADGHIVTRRGLRVKTQCYPERNLNLPKWVPGARFQVDLDREIGQIDPFETGSGHGQYRVYAKYQPYCQPTETGRIRMAKSYAGIDVVSVRSLYHGAGRVKVGEVTL